MWRQATVTVDEAQAEPLSDLFVDIGAVSVGFEDAGDQPLFEPKPGETPLWRRTQVIALFEADADEAEVRAAVEAQFGGRLADWVWATIEDQVWERAWLDHFKPMQFGRRLWVCPTGFAPPDPAAVNVILDPGLAFGTGTHPTTALCLEWLDGQDLAGQAVVDYGCGSGILAVAALKLGADSAWGVDIDPQAITASADNARKNGVEAGLKLGYPKDLPTQPADILLANILAGPLVELADAILAHLRPGGRLALSGILAMQAETVRRAYESRVELAPTVIQEDWVLLAGVKRAE
ncbi:50S ribosomal protein L11 methyltransferase [Methylomagnum sp.]